MHVPGYDSDFEEAMVQRGCLWVGSGRRVVRIGGGVSGERALWKESLQARE